MRYRSWIARRTRWTTAALCGVFALTSSAAHGGVWTTSHGPVGGRMASLAVDPTSPSTIYLGTCFSGAFKSVDGGDTWSPLPTGIPTISASIISGLVVDPVTPTNVYASVNVGVDGGILRSADAGAHWSYVPVSEAFAIAIDPTAPTTLYLGASPKLLKSTDAGLTWRALAPSNVFGVAVDPVTPRIVYAADGGVSKSIDGGATWTDAGVIPGTALAATLAIDPTAPKTIYVGTTGGVFKSVDAGDHWTPLGPIADQGFGLDTFGLAIDPANPNVVYAAGLASAGFGVYKSTDGGAHWTGTPIAATTNAIALSTSSRLVAGTTDAGVFLSTDRAATWNASNTGVAATTVLSLAPDPAHPGKVYAGTDRNLAARSPDGGDTWTAMAPFRSISGITALVVDPTAPGIVYAGDAASDGVFKTVDDGVTWTALVGPDAPINAHALALDPANPQIVYAGVALVGFDVSPDGGASWTPRNTGLLPFVLSLAIDPSAPTTLYAGTAEQGPFKTTDAGAHWTLIATGLPAITGTQMVLTMDPVDPATLYGGIQGAGVFKTTDGGASWTAVNTGLGSLLVSAVAADAVVTGTVYAATLDQGVFTTFDGGASWVPTNDGLFNPRVRSLAVEPGRVYAGTEGNGAFAMAVTATTSTTTTLPTTTTTLPQAVLGRTLAITDPKPGEGGDPSKRKITLTAHEPASDDALDPATLVQGGASLTVTTFGATATSQTFSMPGPWRPVGTTGAKYSDSRGVNGPVKSALVKRSSAGVFDVRVTISGKVSGEVSEPPVVVVPPNPGFGARVVFQIDWGRSYCVGFGGEAQGTIANSGARAFKVSKPTAAVCP